MGVVASLSLGGARSLEGRVYLAGEGPGLIGQEVGQVPPFPIPLCLPLPKKGRDIRTRMGRYV